MCIIKWKEPIWKGYKLCDPYTTFRKTTQIVKDTWLSGTGEKAGTGRTQRVSESAKRLCDTTAEHTCHSTSVQPTECIAPRITDSGQGCPRMCHWLWQTTVRMLTLWELCVSEDTWEPAVLSAQFLCETETALRKKSIKHLPKRQVMLVSLYLTQCCCSVTRSCAALCGLMGCSLPGYSVLHPLPKHS